MQAILTEQNNLRMQISSLQVRLDASEESGQIQEEPNIEVTNLAALQAAIKDFGTLRDAFSNHYADLPEKLKQRGQEIVEEVQQIFRDTARLAPQMKEYAVKSRLGAVMMKK